MHKKEMTVLPNNIVSKGIPNDEPELVTISGLQFKPYQMQCRYRTRLHSPHAKGNGRMVFKGP
jgi:hypothetical protein